MIFQSEINSRDNKTVSSFYMLKNLKDVSDFYNLLILSQFYYHEQGL